MSDWQADVIANTFERWGSALRPELSREQTGKLLSISLGLGSLFRESREAECAWMHSQHHAFKTRPITMILAGNFDDVLDQVEKERNVR